MSHQSVAQESTRVSCKSVPQSDESLAQECPTRVFYKSVSYKTVKKCLGVSLSVRVCIRIRGFHLVFWGCMIWWMWIFLRFGKSPKLREDPHYWFICSGYYGTAYPAKVDQIGLHVFVPQIAGSYRGSYFSMDGFRVPDCGNWLPLPPCFPILSPFMISLLAAAAVLFLKPVSLHDFALGCRCRIVSQACLPS